MRFAFVVLLIIATVGCGYSSKPGMTPGGSVQVMQVVPNNINAGESSFMMTVNGSGFSMNSVVYFNGMVLSTTFVAANQLVAGVPASLIAMPETAQVYVRSNNTNSNTINFAVQ
jgi:hypothetical protein